LSPAAAAADYIGEDDVRASSDIRITFLCNAAPAASPPRWRPELPRRGVRIRVFVDSDLQFCMIYRPANLGADDQWGSNGER